MAYYESTPPNPTTLFGSPAAFPDPFDPFDGAGLPSSSSAAPDGADARLWTGFEADSVETAFRSYRQDMPSGLLVVGGGHEGQQAHPVDADARSAGDGGAAGGQAWQGWGAVATSLDVQVESAASLWTRHQLERWNLFSAHESPLGSQDRSDEASALLDLSVRQTEWCALFVRQEADVQALIGGPTGDMSASLITIHPARSILHATSPEPAALDDDLPFEMEGVTSAAAAESDGPAPLPISASSFVSPVSSISSESSRGEDSSGASVSPEIVSSSWSTDMDFDLDDVLKLGPSAAAPTPTNVFGHLTAYRPSDFLSGSAAVRQVNLASRVTPSANPAPPAPAAGPSSRAIRRTSAGAPFERNKFSCDRCARARKKCSPHPRADGSVPEHGDCSHCVADATRRHLPHVDCTYEMRASNVDRARKNGSLREAYHHVAL